MFLSHDHFWNDAVARNTEALKFIIASLVELLKAYGGTEAVRVPRAIRSIILQVLKPAESALRRVILIVARDMKPESPVAKAKPQGKIPKTRAAKTQRMSFQLFDPRKRFGQQRVTYTRFVPRVFFIEPAAPFSPLYMHQSETLSAPDPAPEKTFAARRLCLRLKAIAAALENVPHQARRLVRLQARRENKKSMITPLRPGKPPGHRNIPRLGIDFVLAECHKFALGVLAESRRQVAQAPNTS